jgi:hypothetical protein
MLAACEQEWISRNENFKRLAGYAIRKNLWISYAKGDKFLEKFLGRAFIDREHDAIWLGRCLFRGPAWAL